MNKNVVSLLTLLGATLSPTLSSFAQTTTLYSTVGGTVWQDNLPSDGIRQAGEAAIPGILVSLYNASNDSLISAAISDPNGEYALQNYRGTGSYYLRFDYPADGYSLVTERAGSDNLINSSADPNTAQSANFTISSPTGLMNYGLGLQANVNTITHCRSKIIEPTNWLHTFTIPKAPIATGTLTGVTLFASDAVRHPMIGIENTGGLVTEASLEFSGRLTLTVPSPGAPFVTNTAFGVDRSLNAYDGTTDYLGTSGASWFNYFSAAYNERSFSAANQLNPYIGTGNLSIPAQAQSFTGILGGGNLENVVQTHVAGGVCVVYKFAGGILPVSLSSFTARKLQQQTELQWKTVAELNNKGFTLERSADGVNFEAIIFVASKAKDGLSTEELTYNYIDRNPLTGKNIYRLKQIDIDGKSSYTKQVIVHFGSSASSIDVYPNPADHTVTINAAATDNVALYSITGRKISVPVVQNNDFRTMDLRGLTEGQYFIHTTSATETKIAKLVIQR